MLLEQYVKTMFTNVEEDTHQEWEWIAAKMFHVALKQLCTLVGGFTGADGGRHEMIPGTYWTDNMGRRDRTSGNSNGDISVIELTWDVLS